MNKATSTQALLSLDASLEMCSKSDELDVMKEQAVVRGKQAEATEFQKEYKAMRATLAPDRPKAKAKAKTLAKEGKMSWCATAPDRIPSGFIDHALAKTTLPPKASIRRMLVGGACHYPPYG